MAWGRLAIYPLYERSSRLSESWPAHFWRCEDPRRSVGQITPGWPCRASCVLVKSGCDISYFRLLRVSHWPLNVGKNVGVGTLATMLISRPWRAILIVVGPFAKPQMHGT